MIRARRGKIGVYGCKTRKLQRCLSFEAFGLSMKDALVYLYQGDSTKDQPKNNDVGSTVFFEVPDRAYAKIPVAIPIGMELLQESASDFSRFGLINPMGDENTFRVHIDDFKSLGRELMSGDIIHIPFHDKDEQRALWEITDVDFKSEMERFIVIIKASPLKASRTSSELDGIMNRTNDDFMVDISNDQERIWEEQVPTQDLQYDKEAPPPTPEEVDYRDDLQADFLDDPFKDF